jgi:hypothetical protein
MTTTEPPASSATTENGVKVVLAEYEQLKKEQGLRIGIRDGLPYVAFAAKFAAFGGSARYGLAVLLVLPLVNVALSNKYLANDAKVTELRNYFQQTSAPHLRRHVPPGTPVLGWEGYHVTDVDRRRSRMLWHAVADLATFCLPGTAGLATYLPQAAGQPAAMNVLAYIEIVLMAAVTWRLLREAVPAIRHACTVPEKPREEDPNPCPTSSTPES